MDYKYIQQLLERYWQCDTTIEEENILRNFFCQKDVPAELEKYRPLFSCRQEAMNNDVLGNDFDEKILSIIDNEKPVKARLIPITQRLAPLFKAAAVVAMIVTLGNAAQMSFSGDKASDSVSYSDDKAERQQAFDNAGAVPLQLTSEGDKSPRADSALAVKVPSLKDSIMAE